MVYRTMPAARARSRNPVDHKLHAQGVHSYVLDGDNVRLGLNAAPGLLKERHGEEFGKRFGLGFSAQDREEKIAGLVPSPTCSPRRARLH